MRRCSECGWIWEGDLVTCPLCESEYSYPITLKGGAEPVKPGAAVTAQNETCACVTHGASHGDMADNP